MPATLRITLAHPWQAINRVRSRPALLPQAIALQSFVVCLVRNASGRCVRRPTTIASVQSRDPASMISQRWMNGSAASTHRAIVRASSLSIITRQKTGQTEDISGLTQISDARADRQILAFKGAIASVPQGNRERACFLSIDDHSS